MAKLIALYEAACPNCGGVISEERLERGLPCSACIPLPTRAEEFLAGLEWRERVLAVARLLEEHGSLEGWSWLANEEEELDLFERFFERIVGRRPWSVQRQWARRLLRGESFAITAPTGTGKSTLLMVYTLYSALKGKRVYYLLPTSSLARQVSERLAQASERLEGVEIAYYHSMLPARARREQLERIEGGGYNILVTTTAFLSRRWGLLEGQRFDVIVVDDVDAILRESSNVERVLHLLGADRELLRKASRLVRLELRVAANPALRTRYASEIEELRRVVKEAERRLGQLVIASATGRPRGFKRLVLQKLLGLSVGSVTGYARNIAEFKLVESSENEAIEALVGLVEQLGPGGLVFIAKPLGSSVARRVADILKERGIRAGLALSGRRVIERFERGEYEVLVGVASYYGVMVRGIDMPQRVAYAVFLEPPHNRVELEKALTSPRRILVLAKALGLEYGDYARLLARLSPDDIMLLRNVLEGRLEPGERLARVAERARELAGEIMRRVKSLTGSLETPAGVLSLEGDKAFILTPDPYTYIQASGRTSRLLRGVMTRGLVVIISWHPGLLRVFEARMSRLVPGFSLRDFDEEEVRRELGRVWESRRSGRGSIPVDIETGLLLVESPTKARLIAGFWGRPARKNYQGLNVYETVVYNPHTGKTHVLLITSVKGHVYDLTEEPIGEHGVVIDGDEVKPVYAPIVKCRACGAQHAMLTEECPECGSRDLEDKRRLVESIRRIAPLVDVVYIATDPDAEGEKIAWDLYVLLKPYARSVKRIEFHEVTREAILKALASPRAPDRKLVEAQMLRRMEDRWIGFELSKHLWSVYGARWLGAGRVQTPALGFLVERLEEWRKARCYTLLIEMPWGRVRLCYERLSDAREAMRNAAEEGVEITILEERDEILAPPPPYTTETLLFDASRLLGYTSERTMRIAQELFENGLITYHRTDSIRVSSAGINVARRFFEKRGLLSEFVPRGWGEGGAHEAIRPTMPLDADELRDAIAMGEVRVVTSLREGHYKLYNLILRRFIASQSRPARVKRARVEVRLGAASVEEDVVVEVYEWGFLRFYPHLVSIAVGLRPGRVKPGRVKLFRSSRVRLYTHGDLVLEMKRVGIGRPSTYAKIIDALKRHGYVVESRYRKYLVPTRLGREVYHYLVSNFHQLVSVERTRLVEDMMDKVARGELNAADVALELLREVKDSVASVEGGRSGEGEIASQA